MLYRLLLNDLYHLLYYFGIEHPYLLCVIVLCLSFIWLVHFVYSRCIHTSSIFWKDEMKEDVTGHWLTVLLMSVTKLTALKRIEGLYEQMNSRLTSFWQLYIYIEI